jgi:peptidoglycan glycosyltransferase
MNRSLHQLFIAVLTLFAVLAASTTYIMTVRANSLNEDTRNTRALYHEFAVPRGAILASDGTVMAQSTASNDAFEYQRKYPNGYTYAPVTGYFSITNRADRGLEASQNSLLNGENDSLWLEKIKAVFKGEDNKGATIETSIDSKLQKLAYKLLGSKTGAVVAIEPSTGRILAMASTPSYDPNALATHDTKSAASAFSTLSSKSPSPMLNNAISQLYPPGSTFKIAVAAAALESGKYTKNTLVSSPGTYTLPGTKTQLVNSENYGWNASTKISMNDAFAYSSNTAFAQLGQKVGANAISDVATKLGFGTSITVDGSDSTGRPMKASASKFPTGQTADKLALASIGQGDTVETPLQNAMIAAAVANGGKLMRPTLVDRVRSSDLSVISQTSPSEFSEPFSSDTADSLTSMMESVITKAHPNLQISSSVKVAAKTGTAQTGNNSTQDGWITGFAPSKDPKIAVAVVIHNATSYGGDTAGPIMKAIMEEYLDETH